MTGSSMMKKAYLASAYNGLQCCNCICSPQPTVNSSSASPCALPPQRARPLSKRRRVQPPQFTKIQSRNYATGRGRSGPDFRDNMNWPCRKGNVPSAPSPYEIFDMERGARYSKQKYYELVKLYHPDRSGIASVEKLTQVERLERVGACSHFSRVSLTSTAVSPHRLGPRNSLRSGEAESL